MKESKLLGILLAVGLITHFWGLSQPREVIFDEVHFGKFITAYCCTGQRFFDIHPPHAKLMIAGAAWLGGYRQPFDFNNISEPYGQVPIWWMRLIPALAGVLLPLIIYKLLRQLGAGWPLAFLGGWLMLFDNALTIQTRMISLDGVLLVATFGSLWLWLRAENARGRNMWWLFAASGALAGLAVGTKFTGLAALALLGFLWLVRLWPKRREWQKWTKVGALVVACALVVYLAGWALHFMLLPLPGSGDAFLKPNFSGGWLPVVFVRETAKLHQVMFNANYNLTAGHPYASPWWKWPAMVRPVYYWHGSKGGDIYFLGNPLVWWGGGLLFLLALSNAVVDFGQAKLKKTGRILKAPLWLIGVAYVIAMAPLIRVPRALFLYHYLTPLILGIIYGLLWLSASGLFRSPLPKREKYLWYGVLGAAVIVFVYFSPFTYGWSAGKVWHDSLYWFGTWR